MGCKYKHFEKMQVIKWKIFIQYQFLRKIHAKKKCLPVAKQRVFISTFTASKERKINQGRVLKRRTGNNCYWFKMKEDDGKIRPADTADTE